MAMLEAFVLIIVILFLLCYYSASKLSHFRKLGVKGPKPLLFVGNYKDVYLGRETTSDCFTRAYNQFKNEQMVGVYGGHFPQLILRDLNLIRDVLIKDFTKFADRTMGPLRDIEPLSEQMFRLEPERWRAVRTKLSPFFTTGRLKEMFVFMEQCSNELEDYLNEKLAEGKPIEFRETAARYTTEVIGLCAFGIKTNSINREESEFRRMGRQALDTNFKQYLSDRFREYPAVFKIFASFLVDYELVDFLLKVTTESMDYRIRNNLHGHDVIDNLLKLKQDPQNNGLTEADDLFLTSQVFVFFTAGFETTSLTISNALFELAKNPSVQDKVRAEILQVLQKYDGKITYDAVKEMDYVYACFQETLRKYPVLMWVSRTALEEYTFSGTKVTIPEGQQVFIPMYAIQRDPDIFPNPDAFEPERFLGNNAKSRHPMSYLPFGDGPRNCIGSRFARNSSTVALVKILSKFKVEVCEKTRVEYKKDPLPLFLLQPYDGVHLKLSKLEA